MKARPQGAATPTEARWQLHAARAHFSTLVDEALAGRPQRIIRRGRDVAVVISADAYDRLTAADGGLVAFFRESPLAEAISAGEIDLERDRDAIRDLDL